MRTGRPFQHPRGRAEDEHGDDQTEAQPDELAAADRRDERRHVGLASGIQRGEPVQRQQSDRRDQRLIELADARQHCRPESREGDYRAARGLGTRGAESVGTVTRSLVAAVSSRPR